MPDMFLKFYKNYRIKDNSDGLKTALDFKKNITANDNKSSVYRGAGKSLAQPGRKQATVTEDFVVHISYL